MATIERIEPAHLPWSPSAAGFRSTDEASEEYVGRHRRPDTRPLRRRDVMRVLSVGVVGLFYTGRHRRAPRG
jgi:hypothetical protein